METCKIKNLYTLEETIAKPLFEGAEYPWELLPKISAFILELGATLSEEEYEKVGENVWIAKSAKVAPTAFINGPAIIGKKRGGASLCIYPGKCNCRRGCGCWKFHGAEKCNFVQ